MTVTKKIQNLTEILLDPLQRSRLQVLHSASLFELLNFAQKSVPSTMLFSQLLFMNSVPLESFHGKKMLTQVQISQIVDLHLIVVIVQKGMIPKAISSWLKTGHSCKDMTFNKSKQASISHLNA